MASTTGPSRNMQAWFGYYRLAMFASVLVATLVLIGINVWLLTESVEDSIEGINMFDIFIICMSAFTAGSLVFLILMNRIRPDSFVSQVIVDFVFSSILAVLWLGTAIISAFVDAGSATTCKQYGGHGHHKGGGDHQGGGGDHQGHQEYDRDESHQGASLQALCSGIYATDVVAWPIALALISYVIVFAVAVRVERKKYISQQQVWKSPIHDFLAPPPPPSPPAYGTSEDLENVKWTQSVV